MAGKAIANLLGLVAGTFGYLTLLVFLWTAITGAARLTAALRSEETRRTGALLTVAPGRCLLSGIAHLIVALLLLNILGAINGLLALLFFLWWLRAAFRGAVSWMTLRGGELHAWRHGTAGTEAEDLDAGIRALAMISALPVAGWAYLAWVLFQGLGAETLRMMKRRAEVGEPAGPPLSTDRLGDDDDPEDDAANFDVDEDGARR